MENKTIRATLVKNSPKNSLRVNSYGARKRAVFDCFLCNNVCYINRIAKSHGFKSPIFNPQNIKWCRDEWNHKIFWGF